MLSPELILCIFGNNSFSFSGPFVLYSCLLSLTLYSLDGIENASKLNCLGIWQYKETVENLFEKK